jgi:hypothetical protein
LGPFASPLRRSPTYTYCHYQPPLANHPHSPATHPSQDAAEFGRIGRYYATESMLVWDEARGAYDADATPEYGVDTLEGFFKKAVTEGLAGQELGDQAVFGVGE